MSCAEAEWTTIDPAVRVGAIRKFDRRNAMTMKPAWLALVAGMVLAAGPAAGQQQTGNGEPRDRVHAESAGSDRVAAEQAGVQSGTVTVPPGANAESQPTQRDPAGDAGAASNVERRSDGGDMSGQRSMPREQQGSVSQ
jgi:hypothetical protein